VKVVEIRESFGSDSLQLVASIGSRRLPPEARGS